MIAFSFFVVLLVVPFIFGAQYQTPPPTFEAKEHTKWNLVKRTGSSKRADIHVDFTAEDGTADFVHMYRIDLVGSAYERGYAQGYLLSKEMLEFLGPKMNQFYMSFLPEFDVSQFPEPLQTILKSLQKLGKLAAPKVFKEAMAWVWEQEKQYVPSYYFDEINGMAQGVCDSVKSDDVKAHCDVNEWVGRIQELNMLPELIRMACTSYGAWGKATTTSTNGGLIQLRSLDFGGGPFANYTVIATHRATDSTNAYTTVSFPGFVGVVTGVSQNGVGISEKVWMTYDKRSLQPGCYCGEPDTFVLRDLLQNSKNRFEAEQYIQSINRTWAIWLGVGDYETQKYDEIGYKHDSALVYTDETMPTMTGQPYLENIAYVDKHPQPSTDTSLPTALSDFYGNISLETTKQIIQYHHTGDVHIASYDYKNKQMYVAIGRINAEGNYGPEGGGDGDVWKAYNRPYLKFNLNDLWHGV